MIADGETDVKCGNNDGDQTAVTILLDAAPKSDGLLCGMW